VPLGVASAAGAEAGPDFALTSDVAPGSSGKIISATALLAQGVVTENTPVACPFAYTVQGVNYDNDDGETLAASTPFAYDFAQSCNNAFDQWRSDESNGRLATAAREYYGLDEPWDIGMSESGTYYEQPPSPNQNVAVACLVLNAGYGAQFAASEVLKFLKSY
jgi:cell division protein FtsI/penicillin-binding protein 2